MHTSKTVQNVQSAAWKEKVTQGEKGQQRESYPMSYITSWSKNTSNFRNLLNTSKGRDKFS